MRLVNVLDIEPYDTVKYGPYSIRYMGDTLWNALHFVDEHFKNVEDLSIFKSIICMKVTRSKVYLWFVFNPPL